jgi:ASC-1-like (ASCH) protein
MQSTIHPLHCQEPWCQLLQDKEKTVEGRLNDKECSMIRVGDQIKFYNEHRVFLATVTKVQQFATLPDYLDAVGLQNALPGIKSIEEGCQIYLKFYTPEQIQKFGVLAFWVQRPVVDAIGQ